MSKTILEWDGWTAKAGDRTYEIGRSHGNWLASARRRKTATSAGEFIAGEYFPYGEPGSLQRAKAWCQSRHDAIQHRKTVKRRL